MTSGTLAELRSRREVILALADARGATRVRDVDVVTEEGLRPRVAARVVADAVVL